MWGLRRESSAKTCFEILVLPDSDRPPIASPRWDEPASVGPGALNIADAKRFQLDDVVRIGPDVRLTAAPLK
jgi:hypothetical protein